MAHRSLRSSPSVVNITAQLLSGTAVLPKMGVISKIGAAFSARLDGSSRLGVGALLLAASGLTACGGGFDPGSELKSLRVLGVQKSAPYPRPGEDVTLTMLWHDAREAEEGTAPDASDPKNREVSVLWLPLCMNPPGDLYQGCFEKFDPTALPMLQGKPLTQEDLQNDRVTFTIPPDILNDERKAVPGQPRYGLFYTFFAACAGRLELSQPGLPECVVESGERRQANSDEFVIGYSAMYVFENNPNTGEPFRNQNPRFSATPRFVIGGKAVVPDCMDPPPEDGSVPSCVTESGGQLPLPTELDPEKCEAEGDETTACTVTCEQDGDSDCPGVHIGPTIDPDVAERDEVSRAYYGRDTGEQMWINYYVARGGLKSEVRLLSDAQEGFTSRYTTEFYAPKEPGTSTVWAVVHDNRGGQSFMRKTLLVRERATP